MFSIENLTNQAHQQYIIPFHDEEIIITLRFLNVVSIWTMDVSYKNKNINGIKLSIGVFLLNNNLPFDFVVIDKSIQNVDPFQIEDFATNRCKLHMLDDADMENIRGYAVKL